MIQVHFIADDGAEGGKRFVGIVLLPVKAPVNEGLDTPAQGLEQPDNRQGGSDERNVIGLLDQSS